MLRMDGGGRVSRGPAWSSASCWLHYGSSHKSKHGDMQVKKEQEADKRSSSPRPSPAPSLRLAPGPAANVQSDHSGGVQRVCWAEVGWPGPRGEARVSRAPALSIWRATPASGMGGRAAGQSTRPDHSPSGRRKDRWAFSGLR